MRGYLSSSDRAEGVHQINNVCVAVVESVYQLVVRLI